MKLELRKICKSFDDKVVLKDVDFNDDIRSIAIIGTSGCGKSTLLRMIGGLLIPNSGGIFIDGKEVDYDEKALQVYRKNIGFVFQSKGLFLHMTAMENVILPLIHTFGINKTEAIERADKLFDRFGLSTEKDKFPFQLSGGQQQRIAIARAVIIEPKILLLDEPTSALDPEYTAEVLDMLGELQNDGLNTIVVTHEIGFAKNACEKVMFIANNSIVESGNSTDVFKNPKSKELKTFLNKILEWRV